MQAAFDEIMQSVCHQSLLEDYQAAKDAPMWMNSVVLNEADLARLSKKTALLPADYKTIFFCRYCFDFSAKDTEEMFAFENVAGQLRYVQNMLAFFMGIEEARIDDVSFHEAAKMALDEYVTLDNAISLVSPKYSGCFRRKLRNIKAAQRLTDYILLVAKRVAVFFLVFTISVSTVLAVNADARELFFTWLVETFPQFSIFIARSPESREITMEDFKRVEVQYVPDGFVLDEKTLLESRVVYQYRNKQGDRIRIDITGPSRKNLDTEDAAVQRMEFKGNTAFFWTKGNSSYLVWQQDGLSCNIIANCNADEIIKIAKNVTL